MPFGLSDKSYNLIKDVFKSYQNIDSVEIFGSRAMGTEKNGSDIDLVLKGSSISFEDILNISSELDDLPLAYQYDIMDYYKIDNIALTEHIDKYGIVFYFRDALQCVST